MFDIPWTFSRLSWNNIYIRGSFYTGCIKVFGDFELKIADHMFTS